MPLDRDFRPRGLEVIVWYFSCLVATFQAGIAQMAVSGQKSPQSILGGAGQVSLMITLAQKERLREMGYSDDQITVMTPEYAHNVLGL